MPLFRLATALFLAMLPLRPAYSTVTTFSDSESFKAAVTGVQTIGFDGLITSTLARTSGSQSYPLGLTVGGVTLTGSSAPLSVVDPANPLVLNRGTGSGAFVSLTPGSGLAGSLSQIVIDLPLGITAFAVDLSTYASAGTPVTISFGSTSVVTRTSSLAGTPTFIGFASSDPISRVLLSAQIGQSGAINLDNLRIGLSVPAVPETTTWLTLLLGFAGAGLALRRGRVHRRRAAIVQLV